MTSTGTNHEIDTNYVKTQKAQGIPNWANPERLDDRVIAFSEKKPKGFRNGQTTVQRSHFPREYVQRPPKPKPLSRTERQNLALWGELSPFAFDEISRLQGPCTGRPQRWMTFERWLELEDFQRAELRTAMDRFPGGKKWLGLLDERRWQTSPEELKAGQFEPGKSSPTQDPAAADTAKSMTEKPRHNLAMPKRITDEERIFSPRRPRPTAPDLGKPVPLTPEYEAALRARGKQIPDTAKRRPIPMSALQTGRETSISQVKSTESEPQPLATPLSVPVPVPVAAAVPGGAAASPPSLKKNETETEFILKIKKARKKAPPPAEISGQPPSGDIVTAFNVPLLNVEKPDGSRSPDVSAVAVTRFKRVASVKTWVLENARGVCECCKRQAPFFSLDGLPYLEVHHVKPLREGGSDTVSNAVSLCPNCHRELHFGAKKSELVIHLYKTVSRLIGE